MALIRGKQAIGLDIGQSSVKLVQLARRGKTLEVVRREIFDARAEGILDEQELHAAAASWLADLGLGKREFSIGIPQYFATTQVSDFPPNVSGDELNGMVTFETVQLAGLSDDSFVSDYHVMNPDFGRNNPVLIGICRQSVVDDRASSLREAGIHLAELSMNGIAAANALFHLHPEAATEKQPQLILDLGVENSTLMVVAAGQILYVGSLMFGGSKFDEMIAAHLQCTREEAEKVKTKMRLDPGDLDSPIMKATRVLQNEIRNSIEHWRASEREEIASKMFGKIWICGGGGALPGLDGYLGRVFGCIGRMYGPPDADGNPCPRLATALGLALQDLKASHVSISLCPPIIRWVHQRQARFGYLLGATAILLFLITAGLLRFNASLDQRGRDLQAQIRNLDQCEKLIPRLEENLQLVRHHEKMMIPVVEKANRAGRFIGSIDVAGSAHTEDDWFIYIADEFSFEEGKPKDDEAKKQPEGRPATGDMMFPGAIASLDTGAAGAPPPSDLTPVTKMEKLRSMVLAGHSPKQGRDSLAAVRDIRKKLNDSPLFTGADLLPKPQRVGREQEIFRPWLVYMQKMAEQKILGQYISFMFRLPFATFDVFEDRSTPAKKS